MSRVAVGTTTAVEMSSFKSRRVVNGTVRDVGLRDCEFWEEKLRDAQFQIDELKRRNKALEEQLRIRENGKDVGKRDMETVKPGGENCLVMGDSIVRNVGAEKANMRVECFPGIRSDQLRRVVENRATERRDLGNPDAVVTHVGTNNIKRSRNLDHHPGCF